MEVHAVLVLGYGSYYSQPPVFASSLKLWRLTRTYVFIESKTSATPSGHAVVTGRDHPFSPLTRTCLGICRAEDLLLLRGAILYRTYRAHKKIHISLFLPTIFGHIFTMVPRYCSGHSRRRRCFVGSHQP